MRLSFRRIPTIRHLTGYIEVLKPMPSVLLTFIGICSAVIATGGALSGRFFLVGAAIMVASAGANGLTNYLDRNLDARMARTRHRVLASGRINPPRKVLPLIVTLIAAGLLLSWWLHPIAFIADVAGTAAAATWRKKVTCVYPQGVIASCAPVFIGWFAVRASFGWELLFLCLMIAAWLPLHVWSVIIANREDYLQAGLAYFPINYPVKDSVKVLFVFSLALYAASLALYFAGSFAWLYLVLVNLFGTAMVYASGRLVASHGEKDAWRLYKLSAYPYMGIIFTVMCLDIWWLG